MNLDAAGTELLVDGKRAGVPPDGTKGYQNNAYQLEHDVLFDAIRNDKPHNEAEYGTLQYHDRHSRPHGYLLRQSREVGRSLAVDSRAIRPTRNPGTRPLQCHPIATAATPSQYLVSAKRYDWQSIARRKK